MFYKSFEGEKGLHNARGRLKSTLYLSGSVLILLKCCFYKGLRASGEVACVIVERALFAMAVKLIRCC